jgi:hypothetical protein
VLLCAYIESLLIEVNGYGTPSQPPRPSSPSSASSTPSRRRSLDYVAERPDGEIASLVGEEFCVGIGYEDIDLDLQRKRLMRRFISKSIPQISLFDYLQRYACMDEG